VLDLSAQQIAGWNSENLPIYEPGLDEVTICSDVEVDGFVCFTLCSIFFQVVVRTRNKNLFFSTDVDGVVEDSDIIFISVNTPTKLAGIGAGRAANIKNCELAARNIAKVSTRGKIVVEKSTVPVRTAQAVATVLANNDKGLKFQVKQQDTYMSNGNRH
jgi:UDPglucose 6-dehydrogenase